MLARGEIPQSVCSLPCGLGEIKSFEVRHPTIFKSNLQLKTVDHKFVNGKGVFKLHLNLHSNSNSKFATDY